MYKKGQSSVPCVTNGWVSTTFPWVLCCWQCMCQSHTHTHTCVTNQHHSIIMMIQIISSLKIILCTVVLSVLVPTILAPRFCVSQQIRVSPLRHICHCCTSRYLLSARLAQHELLSPPCFASPQEEQLHLQQVLQVPYCKAESTLFFVPKTSLT